MSVINLGLPIGEIASTGKHIFFSAPCSCDGVTGVKIGETTYDLINAEGKDYVSNGGTWVSGAYITIILDCTNNKAYVVSEHSVASDVVRYTAQTLTADQKTQARTNIGAGTSSLVLGSTSTTAAAGDHTHDYIPNSSKGEANGVAELDSNGNVPSAQLPSYVDDVLEYANKEAFPNPGESGKIYVAINTNKTYRWSGSDYVEISESLALGTTSSTAFAGDKGNTAYLHSQVINGNPHGVTYQNIGGTKPSYTASEVGLGNVGNFKAVSTEASQDLTDDEKSNARTNIDVNKVESSKTNGNIKINGTETTIYTHPSGTNPHGTTATDVGLGNVGNFKAVSTVASQSLNDTEKLNARTNIGAGTSSFSGSYNDLSDKPTDIVKYTSQTLTEEQKTQARTNIGAGTVTSVTVQMNGSTKGTITDSGTIDLGTVITDVSSYATTSSVTTKLNRNDNVNSSNTSYTTYMARGEALNSSDTSPSANGCISWTYE